MGVFHLTLAERRMHMKFVIAILIAVGLFLMWKKTEWNKVLKIILTVVLGLVLIGCLLPSSNDDSKKAEDKPKAQQEQSVDEEETKTETKEEEPAPDYIEVTTDELSDALDANAMNASDTYKDKYVAVTGRLAEIDSDGKYIVLADVNDELSFYTIKCNIKSDEQLEKVKQMTKDDTVVIRGQITDVGEFMQYTMNIDSID